MKKIPLVGSYYLQEKTGHRFLDFIRGRPVLSFGFFLNPANDSGEYNLLKESTLYPTGLEQDFPKSMIEQLKKYGDFEAYVPSGKHGDSFRTSSGNIVTLEPLTKKEARKLSDLIK